MFYLVTVPAYFFSILLKDNSPDVVLRAIRLVADGRDAVTFSELVLLCYKRLTQQSGQQGSC